MNNGLNNRFTLPKRNIIKKSQEFRDILSSGIFFKSHSFILVARPSSFTTKIGFTVQRRIRPAVKRNRIKKKCRELWRLCCHILTINADIILIGKESMCDTTFDALKLEFIRLLRRLNSNKSFQ